jgi:large subunit ribosomal protein L30
VTTNPKRLKITLKRSTISTRKRQRDTLTTLGLKRINDSVERDDSPSVRGMINKVSHLIEVEEVEA